jgi:hypothetical protein
MAVTVGSLGDVMLQRAVAWRLASMPPPDVWAPVLRALMARCDPVADLECYVPERGHRTVRIEGEPFSSGPSRSATGPRGVRRRSAIVGVDAGRFAVAG